MEEFVRRFLMASVLAFVAGAAATWALEPVLGPLGLPVQLRCAVALLYGLSRALFCRYFPLITRRFKGHSAGF